MKTLSSSPKNKAGKPVVLKKKLNSLGNALQTFGFNQLTEEIKRRAELAKSKPKEQGEEKLIDIKVLV